MYSFVFNIFLFAYEETPGWERGGTHKDKGRASGAAAGGRQESCREGRTRCKGC